MQKTVNWKTILRYFLDEYGKISYLHVIDSILDNNND